MSQKKLYLHAGPPKTGTTSIQRFLSERHSALLRHNKYALKQGGENHVEYWTTLFCTFDEVEADARISEDNVNLFTWSWMLNPRIFGEARDRLQAEILEASDKAHDIILSSEDLIDAPDYALQRIQDWFSSLGYQVKVIFYLRHPYEWALSKIAQRVNYFGLLECDFVSCVDMNRRTEDWIQRAGDIFGTDALDLRTFGRWDNDDGLLEDFCDAIDIKFDRAWSGSSSRNKGQSLSAIHLYQHVNKLVQRHSCSDPNRPIPNFYPILYAKSLRSPWRGADEQKFNVQSHLQAEILGQLEDGRLELRRRSGNEEFYGADFSNNIRPPLSEPTEELGDETVDFIIRLWREVDEARFSEIGLGDLDVEAEAWLNGNIFRLHSPSLARDIRDHCVRNGKFILAETMARMAIALNEQTCLEDLLNYGSLIVHNDSFPQHLDTVLHKLFRQYPNDVVPAFITKVKSGVRPLQKQTCPFAQPEKFNPIEPDEVIFNRIRRARQDKIQSLSVEKTRSDSALRLAGLSMLASTEWNNHPHNIERDYKRLSQDIRFDAIYYAKQCRSEQDTNKDPLTHYLTIGFRKGLRPNPWFDPAWFVGRYGHAEISPLNPLIYYINDGWKQGFSPSAEFDLPLYLKRYPDIKAAGIEPMRHFIRIGQSEGRVAS